MFLDRRQWAKAAQRSLERAALPEAAEQLNQALSQIAALPSTPALRREEIKLQVALITALIHLRGYGVPETKAAALRARALIEQAEARGEIPEDPLVLFSLLYSFWVSHFNGFHANTVTELAAQFLKLAEQQNAAARACRGTGSLGFARQRSEILRKPALISIARSRHTTLCGIAVVGGRTSS
jgi:hypothetical protein